MGNFVTTSPNEALLISGPSGTNITVGKTKFRVWCIQTALRLPLELVTCTLASKEAETVMGVRVNVTSIAQIKIRAWKDAENNQAAKTNLDIDNIRSAAQLFLGSTPERVRDTLRQTLEGHQRQILGTLTVEEIYKDRAQFSTQVRTNCLEDLEKMGFSLVSYTVINIDDEGGYMESLGATQTAAVQREAKEGKSKNDEQAKRKVAEYQADAEIAAANFNRKSHVEVTLQRQAEAEANRDLALKEAIYAREVNEAKQIALAATQIEQEKQAQAIIRERTQQKVIEAEVNLELVSKEMERVKREKEGAAIADLMAQEKQAQGIRIIAAAKAEEVRLKGQAEADAVRARGEAEAAVLQLRADAYKQYGEAAVVQMIVEQLPKIAAEISKPLAKTEKMVFVSSDGSGPSRFTADMASMLGQMPDAVEALTGFDLKSAIKSHSGLGKKRNADQHEI